MGFSALPQFIAKAILSRIGIIAALPDEAKCLYKESLNVAEPVEIEKDIYLCLSGIGDNSARAAMQSLLKHNIDGVVSWGVAGAIDPKLNFGDILISETVLYNNDKYTCSLNWFNNINQELQNNYSFIKSGMMVTNQEICSSIENKTSLYENTGASAVDMESGAIAELAQSENIDYLILRAISDNANTAIPEVVTNHTDNLGRPDLFPFLFSCIKQPGQIIELVKLARCYKKALSNLGGIALNLKKHHFHYNT